MWKGISYPVKLGDNGLFKSTTDIDLINGNILQIIGTRRGERVMLPLFGSRILDFIFEPLDHITCALMRFDLIQSIIAWEPRILLDKSNTIVVPDPETFEVVAHMQYYLKPRSEVYNYSVVISRIKGVSEWRD